LSGLTNLPAIDSIRITQQTKLNILIERLQGEAEEPSRLDVSEDEELAEEQMEEQRIKEHGASNQSILKIYYLQKGSIIRVQRSKTHSIQLYLSINNLLYNFVAYSKLCQPYLKASRPIQK
jgi:hypothetical protein